MFNLKFIRVFSIVLLCLWTCVFDSALTVSGQPILPDADLDDEIGDYNVTNRPPVPGEVGIEIHPEDYGIHMNPVMQCQPYTVPKLVGSDSYHSMVCLISHWRQVISAKEYLFKQQNDHTYFVDIINPNGYSQLQYAEDVHQQRTWYFRSYGGVGFLELKFVLSPVEGVRFLFEILTSARVPLFPSINAFVTAYTDTNIYRVKPSELMADGALYQVETQTPINSGSLRWGDGTYRSFVQITDGCVFGVPLAFSWTRQPAGVLNVDRPSCTHLPCKLDYVPSPEPTNDTLRVGDYMGPMPCGRNHFSDRTIVNGHCEGDWYWKERAYVSDRRLCVQSEYIPWTVASAPDCGQGGVYVGNGCVCNPGFSGILCNHREHTVDTTCHSGDTRTTCIHSDPNMPTTTCSHLSGCTGLRLHPSAEYTQINTTRDPTGSYFPNATKLSVRHLADITHACRVEFVDDSNTGFTIDTRDGSYPYAYTLYSTEYPCKTGIDQVNHRLQTVLAFGPMRMGENGTCGFCPDEPDIVPTSIQDSDFGHYLHGYLERVVEHPAYYLYYYLIYQIFMFAVSGPIFLPAIPFLSISSIVWAILPVANKKRWYYKIYWKSDSTWNRWSKWHVSRPESYRLVRLICLVWWNIKLCGKYILRGLMVPVAYPYAKIKGRHWYGVSGIIEKREVVDADDANVHEFFHAGMRRQLTSKEFKEAGMDHYSDYTTYSTTYADVNAKLVSWGTIRWGLAIWTAVVPFQAFYTYFFMKWQYSKSTMVVGWIILFLWNMHRAVGAPVQHQVNDITDTTPLILEVIIFITWVMSCALVTWYFRLPTRRLEETTHTCTDQCGKGCALKWKIVYDPPSRCRTLTCNMGTMMTLFMVVLWLSPFLTGAWAQEEGSEVPPVRRGLKTATFFTSLFLLGGIVGACCGFLFSMLVKEERAETREDQERAIRSELNKRPCTRNVSAPKARLGVIFTAWITLVVVWIVMVSAVSATPADEAIRTHQFATYDQGECISAEQRKVEPILFSGTPSGIVTNTECTAKGTGAVQECTATFRDTGITHDYSYWMDEQNDIYVFRLIFTTRRKLAFRWVYADTSWDTHCDPCVDCDDSNVCVDDFHSFATAGYAGLYVDPDDDPTSFGTWTHGVTACSYSQRDNHGDLDQLCEATNFNGRCNSNGFISRKKRGIDIAKDAVYGRARVDHEESEIVFGLYKDGTMHGACLLRNSRLQKSKQLVLGDVTVTFREKSEIPAADVGEENVAVQKRGDNFILIYDYPALIDPGSSGQEQIGMTQISWDWFQQADYNMFPLFYGGQVRVDAPLYEWATCSFPGLEGHLDRVFEYGPPKEWLGCTTWNVDQNEDEPAATLLGPKVTGTGCTAGASSGLAVVSQPLLVTYQEAEVVTAVDAVECAGVWGEKDGAQLTITLKTRQLGRITIRSNGSITVFGAIVTISSVPDAKVVVHGTGAGKESVGWVFVNRRFQFYYSCELKLPRVSLEVHGNSVNGTKQNVPLPCQCGFVDYICTPDPGHPYCPGHSIGHALWTALIILACLVLIVVAIIVSYYSLLAKCLCKLFKSPFGQRLATDGLKIAHDTSLEMAAKDPDPATKAAAAAVSIFSGIGAKEMEDRQKAHFVKKLRDKGVPQDKAEKAAEDPDSKDHGVDQRMITGAMGRVAAHTAYGRFEDSSYKAQP
ncbi:hypothetical protein [Sponge holobiont-associated RNA virus]|nr:hypothetical protein [Sponge holobiont-associated RNA virus]